MAASLHLRWLPPSLRVGRIGRQSPAIGHQAETHVVLAVFGICAIMQRRPGETWDVAITAAAKAMARTVAGQPGTAV